MAGKRRALTVKVILESERGDTVLELEESIEIQTDTFADAAALLTQVHELLERIRDGQAGLGGSN